MWQFQFSYIQSILTHTHTWSHHYHHRHDLINTNKYGCQMLRQVKLYSMVCLRFFFLFKTFYFFSIHGRRRSDLSFIAHANGMKWNVLDVRPLHYVFHGYKSMCVCVREYICGWGHLQEPQTCLHTDSHSHTYRRRIHTLRFEKENWPCNVAVVVKNAAGRIW